MEIVIAQTESGKKVTISEKIKINGSIINFKNVHNVNEISEEKIEALKLEFIKDITAFENDKSSR